MLTEAKEEILVWIRPTSEVIRDGEVVFLTGHLKDTCPEKFEGLASLRDLAVRLRKPVVLCAVECGGALLPEPRLKITPKTTNQDLEGIAKKAGEILTYFAVSPNTHYGIHRVPTFFVGRC